jgi:hypothetical protein
MNPADISLLMTDRERMVLPSAAAEKFPEFTFEFCSPGGKNDFEKKERVLIPIAGRISCDIPYRLTDVFVPALGERYPE